MISPRFTKPSLREELVSDRGAIALIVAISIVALLGVTALSVDMGTMYAHKRSLQTAADAAALAGVQELPTNPTAAAADAASYVAANTRAADGVTTAATVSTTWAANDTITVVATDPDKPFLFARALGLSGQYVSARSVAMVGSPITYNSGVMPFGTMAINSLQSPFGYQTGTEIDLIVDDGSGGNWHYVDLTNFSDATNTKTIIEQGGSTKPLSIGDMLSTQPGSVENPNFTALSNLLSTYCAPHSLAGLYRDPVTGFYESKHLDGTPCRRLIITPVIKVASGDPFDWAGVSGSSTPVQVIGFLNMFVSNDPTFKDGTLKVTFVQVVPDSAMTPGPVTPFAGLITWLKE